jgi:hypothetical protein
MKMPSLESRQALSRAVQLQYDPVQKLEEVQKISMLFVTEIRKKMCGGEA